MSQSSKASRSTTSLKDTFRTWWQCAKKMKYGMAWRGVSCGADAAGIAARPRRARGEPSTQSCPITRDKLEKYSITPR